MLDELIDRVWLIIYNKNREKNKIIDIGIDKDKDIEGYINIYNKTVNDKLDFVNRISKLFNNAIEKKKFNNLKDDVLKLISNSCIYDVKKKIVTIAKMLILMMIKIMIKIMIMIKII